MSPLKQTVMGHLLRQLELKLVTSDPSALTLYLQGQSGLNWESDRWIFCATGDSFCTFEVNDHWQREAGFR